MRTLMPLAASLLCSRRLSTANGSAGLATRHVSSKNTRRPPSMGIAYRNEGTSDSLPHRPSPALGCELGLNLCRSQQVVKLHSFVQDMTFTAQLTTECAE